MVFGGQWEESLVLLPAEDTKIPRLSYRQFTRGGHLQESNCRGSPPGTGATIPMVNHR